MITSTEARLFGIGVVSATLTTQLRIEGIPIGPAEIFLCSLVLWVWIKPRTVSHVPHQGIARCVLALAIIPVLIAVSNMIELFRSGTLSYSAWHDLGAFVFVAIVLATYAFKADVEAWHTAIRWSVGFGVALTSALLVFGDQNSALWRAGVRFQGLANNPNQVAFFLSPLPFLIAEFVRHSINKWRMAWLCLIPITFIAGVYVLSDALYLSWIIGSTFLALTLFRNERKNTFIFIIRVNILVSVVLYGFIFAKEIAALISRARDIAWVAWTSADEGDSRIKLFRNGLNLSLDHFWFGMGGGAKPIYGETLGEVHNTILDMALMIGWPFNILLILVIGNALLRAGIMRRPYCLSAISAIFIMAFFHFAARHPWFWFVVLYICAVPKRRETAESAKTWEKGGNVWRRRLPVAVIVRE